MRRWPAVRQGFYSRWLRGYLACFPIDRILLLQYERCVADPAGELSATYGFLGLDAHRPADLRRSVNASGTKRPIEPEARHRLRELYRPDVEDLVTLFPNIDLGLWPNFADRAA